MVSSPPESTEMSTIMRGFIVLPCPTLLVWLHPSTTSQCAAENVGWGWTSRDEPAQHQLVEKFYKDMDRARPWKRRRRCWSSA